MANLSKERRDRMMAKLEELKLIHSDDESIIALNEIESALKEKKFGLVFEEHSEAVDDKLTTHIPVLSEDVELRICSDETLPWHFIIEGDNLQALYLLDKTHRGKVDCIYIDPPYNTGASDWKYNNDYVDGNDQYRHSKWLSMMQQRLKLAKLLLNPHNSVLIVTIDEKEYLHLGCLLEEMFPEANMQMISTAIKPSGSTRESQFSRVDEYIFFLMFGEAYPQNGFVDMLYDDPDEISETTVTWQGLRRRGSDGWKRENSPGGFYPIIINIQQGKLVGVGNAIPLEQDRRSVTVPDGCFLAWPLDPQGREGRWQVKPERLREQLAEGTAFLSKYDIEKETCSIKYLKDGDRNRVMSGELDVSGRDAQTGALIIVPKKIANRRPKSMWVMKTHDASAYGTALLSKFIGEQKFTFPKSLYAVKDTIRFFVADKPNAIILDFFAGSGTTLHAVNLLNAEDGGQRTCILVTNNEVSDSEAKRMREKGLKPGDEEWENLGIARYVTWQRTKCSIVGKSVSGEPIRGNYIGSEIPIADGFAANVKYFKCDWVPREPEERALTDLLFEHIKEMIELENAIELDGRHYIIVLTEEQADDVEQNWTEYPDLKGIYLSRNVLLTTEQNELFYSKPVHIIPDYYFNIELREVGESW